MARVLADDIALNYIGTEPHLSFVKSTVYDAGGNNNGILDAGETANLTATLKNIGGVDFTNLTTTIACADPYITISDNAGNFGYLGIDSIKENATDPYVVSASPSTPQGYIAIIKLITTDGAFVDTLNFDLTVGRYNYLIWNPDPTPSAGEMMHDILTSLGYTGNHSTTLPPGDKLRHYQSIFVCAGIDPQNYYILALGREANALVDYLNGSGRMYLEGGDVWYEDPLYLCYDFGPLFGIISDSGGGWNLGPVTGNDGTFTQGMNFNYVGSERLIDHTNPTGSGFLILHDASEMYNCGVANDAGTHMTVGISFELGYLIDGSGVSTRAVLLDSIMHFFGISPTGVEEVTKLDITFPTLAVYPNPFHDRIEISYTIGYKSGSGALKIYDATGSLIKEFHIKSSISGRQSVIWDGTDSRDRKLSCGVYFIRLETTDCRETKKVILLK